MIVLMNELLVCIALGLLGMAMGSFAGATVWRLRARQLVEDKVAKEDYDKKEYEKLLPLTKHKGAKDRSRCLSCGHQLAWYDLVPVISWLSTRGKCRYCRHSIGRFEPLIEIGVAAFFVLSYIFWPGGVESSLSIAQFGLWLVGGVMLAILFVYDLKWFLLPDRVIFPFIASGIVTAAVTVYHSPDVGAALLNVGESVFVLSGIYLGLYILSKGAWIGFGDVKLGLALGLILGDWQLALVALFAANLIGCVIVMPGLVTKRLTRTTQVPFGPLLIAGFVLAELFGRAVIDWYSGLVIF
ncbi:MAG: putative Prepilin peptidase [Candidatus Saccharibacteria bacterium]|nr:putative Prepilin peptidase [Candidatus Saccharibacteria bacterium]